MHRVLLASANADRALKRWDRAEAQVRRVLAIDPGGDRARALARATCLPQCAAAAWQRERSTRKAA